MSRIRLYVDEDAAEHAVVDGHRNRLRHGRGNAEPPGIPVRRNQTPTRGIPRTIPHFPLSLSRAVSYNTRMDSIIRNVTDIDQADRQALEHVIGQHLRENQQVVISVLNVDMSKPLPAQTHSTEDRIPEWWKVYDGLSDDEVDRLDGAIRQRANLTRVFE